MVGWFCNSASYFFVLFWGNHSWDQMGKIYKKRTRGEKKAETEQSPCSPGSSMFHTIVKRWSSATARMTHVDKQGDAVGAGSRKVAGAKSHLWGWSSRVDHEGWQWHAGKCRLICINGSTTSFSAASIHALFQQHPFLRCRSICSYVAGALYLLT